MVTTVRRDLTGPIRWGGPLVLLAALTLVRLFGDRWFAALPLLYGPRWPLLIFALSPLLTLRRDKRRALTAAAVALVLGLALLDLRLPWRGVLPPPVAGYTELTVVEWNAGGGVSDLSGGVNLLMAHEPDLLVFAECREGLAGIAGSLPGYSLHRAVDVCIATRRPMIEWSPRDPTEFFIRNGAGAIGRLVIDVEGTEVVVGGVHLETPRDALEALANFAFFSFPPDAKRVRVLRNLESEAARTWIAPAGENRPLIIAGDFNLAWEGAIYRRWWGDLSNAFSSKGLGLGWTKSTRLFGVRIDHVLVGNGIESLSAKLGDAMGGDHRPLITTLAVPTGASER